MSKKQYLAAELRLAALEAAEERLAAAEERLAAAEDRAKHAEYITERCALRYRSLPITESLALCDRELADRGLSPWYVEDQRVENLYAVVRRLRRELEAMR